MMRAVRATLCLASVVPIWILSVAVAGEWDDEFPITQDELPQNRFCATAGPGDVLFVLWPDWTVWEDTQILLMRSEDKGENWTEPATIFAGRAYDNMALLADSDGLHLLLVEFLEEEEEYKRLYHARSTNGGETFSDTVRVGERENIEAIKVFSAAGKLYVYAQNYDYELEQAFNYLYVSEDGGGNWEEKPLLPYWTVQNPDFTVRDGVIHVVFGGLLIHPEIMHSTSADDGDLWTTPVAVSIGAGTHSQLPRVAVDTGAIHVVWEDDRAGYFNVMYSRSADGGLTWSDDLQLNDTTYGARAQLIADEEGLHLAWCQYHGETGWPSSWSSGDYGIIWYKFSDDSGLSWTEEFRVSQNEHIPPMNLPAEGANNVLLVEYVAGFCALWQDKRDGNVDLYLRNNHGPAADVETANPQSGPFRAQPLWGNPAAPGLAALSFRVVSHRSGSVVGCLIDAQGRVACGLPARPLAAGENQMVRWPLPPLEAGIYYVRLVSNGVDAQVRRLVITR